MQAELSRKHQIEEDLTRELDDCHVLLQSKEADCTRLAKNLGASQVREAEQEAKWMYELQKVRQNLEFKNLRQQQEVCIVNSFFSDITLFVSYEIRESTEIVKWDHNFR